ncbi:hypothetical protein RI367_007856 [Sorochytrium milnesiophthora]
MPKSTRPAPAARSAASAGWSTRSMVAAASVLVAGVAYSSYSNSDAVTTWLLPYAGAMTNWLTTLKPAPAAQSSPTKPAPASSVATASAASSSYTPDLTQQQKFVERVLGEHERATPAKPSGHVHAVHTNWVASNNPVEDKHVLAQFKDKLVFGVYDGHAGYQCSTHLVKYMHNYVARHLNVPSVNVSEALENAFLEMDGDLMQLPYQVLDSPKFKNVPMPTVQDILMTAMAGSCAIVTVVDGPDVYVANVGDSRAVLGTLNDRNEYVPVPLSFDHGVENASEVRRMLAEHPGEEGSVIRNGRVLGGLMPFRAMGDARYKWPAEVQTKIAQLFESTGYPYRKPPANLKTPPYVIAKPEVIHHRLTDRDQFMVVATDGLWEVLSNEQVVSLVGDYVRHHAGQPLATNNSNQGRPWTFTDNNAATHLIRNAFGGADADYTYRLLSIPAPHSRRFRDDITILVVFFRDSSVAASGVLDKAAASSSSSSSSSSAAQTRALEYVQADLEKSKTGPTERGLAPISSSAASATAKKKAKL